MGCQNSKLNADILAIPPKLRPLLWRKLEEMRRHRSRVVSGTNTLSKKELLTNGEVLIPPSIDENESSKEASISSSESQPIPEKILKEEAKPETEEDQNEESSGKDEGKDEERDSEVLKPVVVVEEEEEERNIGPESPSFRVYYIESLDEKEDESKSDSTDENDTQKKWLRTNSVDSCVLVGSNEETKTIKKRGKTRMRIRRALCRGGPVAVRHLWNVTSSSCYHPSNERASLITRKSTSEVI